MTGVAFRTSAMSPADASEMYLPRRTALTVAGTQVSPFGEIEGAHTADGELVSQSKGVEKDAHRRARGVVAAPEPMAVGLLVTTGGARTARTLARAQLAFGARWTASKPRPAGGRRERSGSAAPLTCALPPWPQINRSVTAPPPEPGSTTRAARSVAPPLSYRATAGVSACGAHSFFEFL